MTKTSIVLAAALSLAALGCKKSDGDAANSAGGGGGADCAAAIAHGMELSKAMMAQMPGVDDKVLAKMRDLGVKNCTDDKWSNEAVTCMIGAKTMAEGQACYGKLTPAQQAKMNEAARALTPAPAAGSAAAPN